MTFLKQFILFGAMTLINGCQKTNIYIQNGTMLDVEKYAWATGSPRPSHSPPLTDPSVPYGPDSNQTEFTEPATEPGGANDTGPIGPATEPNQNQSSNTPGPGENGTDATNNSNNPNNTNGPNDTTNPNNPGGSTASGGTSTTEGPTRSQWPEDATIQYPNPKQKCDCARGDLYKREKEANRKPWLAMVWSNKTNPPDKFCIATVINKLFIAGPKDCICEIAGITNCATGTTPPAANILFMGQIYPDERMIVLNGTISINDRLALIGASTEIPLKPGNADVTNDGFIPICLPPKPADANSGPAWEESDVSMRLDACPPAPDHPQGSKCLRPGNILNIDASTTQNRSVSVFVASGLLTSADLQDCYTNAYGRKVYTKCNQEGCVDNIATENEDEKCPADKLVAAKTSIIQIEKELCYKNVAEDKLSQINGEINPKRGCKTGEDVLEWGVCSKEQCGQEPESNPVFIHNTVEVLNMTAGGQPVPIGYEPSNVIPEMNKVKKISCKQQANEHCLVPVEWPKKTFQETGEKQLFPVFNYNPRAAFCSDKTGSILWQELTLQRGQRVAQFGDVMVLFFGVVNGAVPDYCNNAKELASNPTTPHDSMEAPTFRKIYDDALIDWIYTTSQKGECT